MEPPRTHTGDLLDGRYRLLSRLGQGGMGTVFVAEHVGLGQRRAIKFLRDDISRKPGAVRRFLQEARALSSLRHEHVVAVLDMGEHAGTAYYVMELLEGEDLRTRLRREGALNWARTREIALQICDALAATHAKGIVHRDLKPENCFCVRHERGHDVVKLIDFGVAKVPREAGGTSQLTGTGETLGTVGYMAPEQMEGQGDLRVDVYSLGVMLFELIAGRPPFVGNTYEVIAKALLGSPPALRSVCPDVAPEIDALVQRALSKDPARRFSTMQQFAAAIAEIPAGSSPQLAVRRTQELPPLDSTGSGSIDPEAATMAAREESSPPFSIPETQLVGRRGAATRLARPRGAVFAGGVAGGAALTTLVVWALQGPPSPPVAAEPPAPAEPGPLPPVPGPAPAQPPPLEPPQPSPTPGPPAAVEAKVEAKTEAGSDEPPPPIAAETPPRVSREQLRVKLTRELRGCRPKFVDEALRIRVTPDRTGNLASLTLLDTHLAPTLATCVEEGLGRVQRALREPLAAKREYEVTVTLTRAP